MTKTLADGILKEFLEDRYTGKRKLIISKAEGALEAMEETNRLLKKEYLILNDFQDKYCNRNITFKTRIELEIENIIFDIKHLESEIKKLKEITK